MTKKKLIEWLKDIPNDAQVRVAYEGSIDQHQIVGVAIEDGEAVDKKRYMVELDVNFEMTVEIVQNENTKQKLHEINNFWGGAESRLSDFDGCIDKTVCELMASEVIRHQARTSFNESLESVIEQFTKGV